MAAVVKTKTAPAYMTGHCGVGRHWSCRAGSDTPVIGKPWTCGCDCHGNATVLTERDLQRTAIGMARWFKWRVVHVRPARTEHGWKTAYEGDPGLPDLILARNGVVLLVELKSDRGQVTAEQQAWLDAAGRNGHLWTPADLRDGTIEGVLR